MKLERIWSPCRSVFSEAKWHSSSLDHKHSMIRHGALNLLLKTSSLGQRQRFCRSVAISSTSRSSSFSITHPQSWKKSCKATLPLLDHMSPIHLLLRHNSKLCGYTFLLPFCKEDTSLTQPPACKLNYYLSGWSWCSTSKGSCWSFLEYWGSRYFFKFERVPKMLKPLLRCVPWSREQLYMRSLLRESHQLRDPK